MTKFNLFRQDNKNVNNTKKIEYNQGLADELKSMAETDQFAAYIPPGKYELLTPEQWQPFLYTNRHLGHDAASETAVYR